MILFVALAVPGLLAITACDHSCTDIGYFCELRVNLEHAEWAPGPYVFELDAGGEVHRCTATLPDPAAATLLCTTTQWGHRFDFDGYPFPSRLMFSGSPKNAEVRILHEGQEVARKTLKPRYEVTEPAGEGCGECRNAEVTVSF